MGQSEFFTLEEQLVELLAEYAKMCIDRELSFDESVDALKDRATE